jgi:hypothetical protein
MFRIIYYLFLCFLFPDDDTGIQLNNAVGKLYFTYEKTPSFLGWNLINIILGVLGEGSD